MLAPLRALTRTFAISSDELWSFLTEEYPKKAMPKPILRQATKTLYPQILNRPALLLPIRASALSFATVAAASASFSFVLENNIRAPPSVAEAERRRPGSHSTNGRTSVLLHLAHHRTAYAL